MKHEVSAGGVVYRKFEGKLQVLVCKHSGYHKWVLPKGRVEDGEALKQTAMREVKEEVGVSATIVGKIEPAESYVYTFNGEQIAKDVQYFLMAYESGDEQQHDFEMEDVRWVSLTEAIALMGYDGAKSVLEKAATLLAEL